MVWVARFVKCREKTTLRYLADALWRSIVAASDPSIQTWTDPLFGVLVATRAKSRTLRVSVARALDEPAQRWLPPSASRS